MIWFLFMVLGIIVCLANELVARKYLPHDAPKEDITRIQDYVIRAGILICMLTPIGLFYS